MTCSSRPYPPGRHAGVVRTMLVDPGLADSKRLRSEGPAYVHPITPRAAVGVTAPANQREVSGAAALRRAVDRKSTYDTVRIGARRTIRIRTGV